MVWNQFLCSGCMVIVSGVWIVPLWNMSFLISSIVISAVAWFWSVFIFSFIIFACPRMLMAVFGGACTAIITRPSFLMLLYVSFPCHVTSLRSLGVMALRLPKGAVRGLPFGSTVATMATGLTSPFGLRRISYASLESWVFLFW